MYENVASDCGLFFRFIGMTIFLWNLITAVILFEHYKVPDSLQSNEIETVFPQKAFLFSILFF